MAAAKRASPVPSVSPSSSPGPVLRPHARLTRPRAPSLLLLCCEPSREEDGPEASDPSVCARCCSPWAGSPAGLLVLGTQHAAQQHLSAGRLPAGLGPSCSTPSGLPCGGTGHSLGWPLAGLGSPGGAGHPFPGPLPGRVPRVGCAEAWEVLRLLGEHRGREAGQDGSAQGLLGSPSGGVLHPAQRRNREGGLWGWGRGFLGPGACQGPPCTDPRGRRLQRMPPASLDLRVPTRVLPRALTLGRG